MGFWGLPVKYGIGRSITADEEKPTFTEGFGFMPPIDKEKFDKLSNSKKAAEILSSKGIELTIVDARFAKPLDEKLIMEIATVHEVVITIEEGSIGGFGSHVSQLLSDRGVFDKGLKFRSMILPVLFLDQDTPDAMYKKAGLDCDSIVEKIENILKSNIVLAKNKNKISN